MSNEALFVIGLVLAFTGVALMRKLFGKEGLCAWMVFATIVANIQVTKTVSMFGITSTLGNALYASNFLATDILSETWSDSDARRCVLMSFVVTVMALLAYAITLWFKPDASDLSHESLAAIFGFMPRVIGASLVAYLVSNAFDISAFSFIRKRHPSLPWLRNNGSTLISQAIDTLIFATLAFYGIYELKVFLEILLSTYAFKAVGAIADTPFFYWARSMGEPLLSGKTKVADGGAK